MSGPQNIFDRSCLRVQPKSNGLLKKADEELTLARERTKAVAFVKTRARIARSPPGNAPHGDAQSSGSGTWGEHPIAEDREWKLV